MKLIDKSALVAEIERRKNYYENIQMIKPVYESNIEDFNELLSFIDTLEVREVQEEPVSEELEEAAIEAFKQIVDGDKNNFFEIFKAGAKWQEKQDQSTIELAEDHAMLAGMEKMKEEMMAKAFPAEIDSSRSDGRCILGGNFARFETGERVKVIVIKED